VATTRLSKRLLPVLGLLLACGGGDLVLPADGVPTDIQIVGGNGQSGRVGVALTGPIVAGVTDAQGRPVAEVRVAFAFTGDVAGASVAPDTGTTDAGGLVQFQVVMGGRVGPGSAEVSVVGAETLAAAVTFTAVSADANELRAAGGDQQSGPAGTVLAQPLVVQVTDAFGNPIEGAPIAWSVDGGGSVSATMTQTGADGHAAVARTLGPAAGVQHAFASSPGLAGSPVTFTDTATAGAATVLEAVSGGGQSGVVGTALPDPLLVRVRDEGGNPVEGLAVAWVVGDGGGSLTPVTSRTDGQGLASTQWTLGGAPGANSATAVVSGLGTVGFTATAVPGTPPGLALATPPPPTAVRGVPLTTRPIVELREPDGTPRQLAGVTVSVSVVQGGAVLQGSTARATGATGRVEFPDLALLGVPGNYALAFSATGYTGIVSPTIALARAPTTITIRSDDPDPSVAGAPVQVRYRVESAGGTPTGLVRITSDDGTSCSGSVAQAECSLSPVTAGARTLTATYAGDTQFEGSSTTAVHQVEAPAPSVLILVIQPSATATSGQPFGRQPVVQLRDGSGAPLPTAGVTVTAAIATGTGTLAGTATRTTGPDGRAVFTDLALAGTGAFTLRFSAEGFLGVVSDAIAVAPAGPAATTTTITADDPDPSDVGQAVTVRFTVSPASGTPTGAVTVSASATETCAAVAGVGTCSLTLTQPGTRTITAAYAGDGTFAGSSGTATHTVRPPPAVPSATTSSVAVKDATVGLTRRTDVTVTVRDAAGAALDRVAVVLSATGTGNLISPASATTDKKGHAKFAFSSADAGAKTLTAVAAGVTIAQQPVITVTPAATQTRITSDAPDPSGEGAPITVAYTVTSDAGTPSGDVTVTASTGGSCTATVAAGGCTLVPGGGGAVTLTASYTAGGNFTASSDQEAHTVTPSNAPPNGQADAFTATEDQALQVSPRGVLTNDSDPNGGTVQAILDAPPAHGQLDLAADGGFRYVPAPDFAGEDGFTYRASDGALASGPVAVRLTVAPINDPPSFDPGPDQTVAGNAGPQTVSSWATNISPGPADESGQQVTFEVDVTLGQALFSIPPAVAPDGTLTFTPSGLPGSALVSVVAHDDGGRSSAGNDTSDARIFMVLVTLGL
jgi:hypothetical protein